MNAPRSLVIAGLSIALLAATASSASALSVSPRSADSGRLLVSSTSALIVSPRSVDFGRLLVNKTSAPVTFTVTNGSEIGDELFNPGSGGSFVTCCDVGSTFLEQVVSCPKDRGGWYYVDKSHPTCTFNVWYHPVVPGPAKAVTLWSPTSPPDIHAELTGTGLLPRLALQCRKKHGHFINRKKSRYCVNRKK